MNLGVEAYLPLLWSITGIVTTVGFVLALWPTIGKGVAGWLVPVFQRLASIAKPARWISEDTRHFSISAVTLGGILIATSPLMSLLDAHGLAFILVATTTLIVFLYGVFVLVIAAFMLFLTTLRDDGLKVRDAGVKFICTAIILGGWVAAITVNAA